MLSTKYLRIVPEAAVFKGVPAGISQTCEIFVSNAASFTMKIKLSIPENSQFALISKPRLIIASGLEEKVKIKFTSSGNEKQKSALLISSEAETVSYPLISIPIANTCCFKPASVDFGSITLGNSASQKFSLINLGTQQTSFFLTPSNQSAKIQPSSGTLNPEQTIDISVSFQPRTIGPFQFQIIPQLDGSVSPPDPLNVSGSVIESSLSVVINGKETTEINFDSIFFGQKAIVHAFIVNKSSSLRSFAIERQPDSIFGSIPSEGEIKPRQRIDVSFVFFPPILSERTTFRRGSSLKLLDTGHSFNLSMQGTAVPFLFAVSTVDIDFGAKKVDSRSSKPLIISNHSQFLSIQFEFKKVAQFHFSPESGAIKPCEDKEINVTFHPRNLGEFKVAAQISFCNGIQKQKISLFGSSLVKESSKFVRAPIWETDESARFEVEHPDPRYGIGLDEIRSKQAVKREFDFYIKKEEEERERTSKKKLEKRHIKEEAEISLRKMGIETTQENVKDYVVRKIKQMIDEEDHQPAEGLAPPDPPLRKKVRSESVKRASKPSLNFQNQAKKTPSTLEEKEDCSKSLTPVQLLKITSSQKIIEFKNISVMSTESKEIQIMNGLDQNIFVNFQAVSHELNILPFISEVIGPRQSGAFRIELHPERIGNYSSLISYTINGYHQFSIPITGNVVPIEVALENPEMKITFCPEEFEQFSKSNFIIKNLSSSLAKFSWSGFSSEFSISEDKGSIGPNSSIKSEIKFFPTSKKTSECFASLSVLGGSTATLHCIGVVPDSSVKVFPSALDLGVIPIMAPTKTSLKLTNSGQFPAFFQVVIKSSMLSCLITSGKIEPKKEMTLQFVVNPSESGKFAIETSINVFGQQPLVVTIKGEAETPMINFDSSCLDFGEVFAGGTITKALIVSNKSNFEAKMVADLSSSPEFSIKDAITIEPSKYLITITPSSSSTINISFSPPHPKKYDFNLQLIPQQPSLLVFSHSVKITAEGIYSPLSVNPITVDFSISPLTDPFNPNNRPEAKQVVIRNEYPRAVNFRLGEVKPPFSANIISGTIEYSSSVDIFFEFRPTEPKPFVQEIPIYVRTDFGESYVSTLVLAGAATQRNFYLSTSRVFLPIVPLGVTTEYTIDILNRGKIDTTFHTVSAVSDKGFHLKTEFPRGSRFMRSTPAIPLKISFNSNIPLSFSTQIAIVAADGSVCTVVVSAVSDNSVFTLYPFLAYNEYKFVSAPGKPITLAIGQIRSDFLSIIASSDFLRAEDIKQFTSNSALDFMKNFISDLFIPISNFPKDFSDSHGELVLSLIEKISHGNPIPQFNYSSKQIKSANSCKDQIKVLLKYLESLGAHVANLVPEFLLPKAEYMKSVKERAILSLMDLYYNGGPCLDSIDNEIYKKFTSSAPIDEKIAKILKISESGFDAISIESWTFLIIQVFKVFYVSFASSLKQVPGFESSIQRVKQKANPMEFSEINKSQAELSRSPVLSLQECLLLKWLTVHFNSESPQLAVVTDFMQLRDGNVIKFVIQSHLQTQIDDPIEAIQKLRLGLNLRKDFLDGGDIETLALLAAFLFFTIPFCAPSESIDFSTPIGTKKVNEISISNPSDKCISYESKLEGSSNFSVKIAKVIVKAKSHEKVEVEYICRRIGSEKAQMLLVPSEKGVSPLIVNLFANAELRPIKTIKIETAAYEPKRESIIINNEFGEKGNFRLFETLSPDLPHFINDPTFTDVNSSDPIDSHQTFIFSADYVSFEDKLTSSKLTFDFVPLNVCEYHCYILFRSEKSGDFLYEICANSTLPKPLTSVTVKAEVGSSTKIMISIGANQPLIKALSYSVSRTSKISEAKFEELCAKNAKEISYQIKVPQFDSEVSMPQFFSIGKEESLQLPLTFSPQNSGEYKASLIMRSKREVRVISIIGFGISKTRTFSIRMSAFIGKELTQEIPVQNPSSEPWSFKVTVDGEFTSSSSFVVPPKSTFRLPITFKPSKVGISEGSVTLFNKKKENSIIYDIKATAEESPSEGKVELRFKARIQNSYNMKVKNFIQSGYIDIENSIPSVECPSNIIITGGEYFEVPLMIYSNCSGITAGTISFLDSKSKKRVWFVVEVSFDPPDSEESIEVRAIVGTKATVQIPIRNSRTQSVDFEVSFEETSLSGSPLLSVPPLSTEVYQIIFSPTQPFENEIPISFYSKSEGEFIYLLKLKADPPEAQYLSLITAKVGTFAETSIQVENFSQSIAKFSIESSNPSVFSVCPTSMILNPTQKKSVAVKYFPSTIGVKECAVVYVRSSEASDRSYKVFGLGKPPNPMTPIIISSKVGEPAVGSINFVHPFTFQTQYSVSICGDQAITLLNRKTTFSLTNRSEEYVIGFRYSPNRSQKSTSTINVVALGIKWEFPVVAESFGEADFAITRKAKDEISEIFELQLSGKSESFEIGRYKLSIESQFEFLSKQLFVRVLEATGDQLRVNVFGKVKRPTDGFAIVAVENPMGQKWQFRIRMQITESEQRTIVNVEGPLGKTTSIRVAVENGIEEGGEFRAYIAKGGASEFSVDPKFGFIEGNTERTELPISILFTPLCYGKTMKALLVFDTKEEQFLFDLRGKISAVNPSVFVTDSGDAKTARKRNIIRENIESARTGAKSSRRNAK